MRTALLTVLGTVMVAMVASGADAPKSPTVDEILNRYVSGSGGREALGRLKTRTMKGAIEVTALGASGQFTVRNKAPNKQASTFDFGGFGTVREGCDGTVAWSMMPVQGVTRKKGSELARALRSTAFPRELRLKETYEHLSVKGAAKVGTVDAWLVEGSGKEGKPDRLYFDQKSGLLIREESNVDTAAGEMAFQIDFEDFRDVDGVKVPFVMKVPQPAQIGFKVTFQEVKHNMDLPDSDFAEPKD